MNVVKPAVNRFYGVCALTFLVLSTITCAIPVLVLGLLKLVPNQSWRVYCTKLVDFVAVHWIGGNNLFLKLFHPAQIEIEGNCDMNPHESNLVVANHQSWLDIVILQQLLNRKIPVIKFFIKDQLKWIPILGFAWWAMGCPFMKRYPQSYLEKYPHKRGKDLKATQKALRLLTKTPSTIMSFVEGTRYTAEKTLLQKSPYQYLLKPKAGGIGFVIDAMSTQITNILDITIVYPDKHYSLWDYLCHRVKVVKIHIRRIPIPTQFLTNSLVTDNKITLEFREWLNERWAEKDALMSKMVLCRGDL